MSLNLKSSGAIISQFAENISNDIDVTSMTNVFRYLRNLCGTSPETQNEVLRDLNILINTKKILTSFLTTENVDQERMLCSQIGLQFLGNLIVNNRNNQQQLWLICQDLLECCLKFQDNKIQSYSSMILYNIFLGNPEFLSELKHPYEDIYKLTMNENFSEFAIFILELFVLKSDYILKFYDELNPESRLIILEIIKNLVTEQNNQTIKSDIIKYFSNKFTSKSDLILKTCESYANSLDPVQIVKILELLVAFSSDDKQCYLEIVQKEISLLINCIELLKSIHIISIQKGNNFSMINKIAELNEAEKETSIKEHPVYGFKCSLIRLIGNFCWKNTVNQNKVRELEGIPILLDCCNIDGRNPFIIQWCILAIRNVCEKNFENQQVIASLSKEGKIDFGRLQELGITLNIGSEGDSICIASLK